ncbi:unnamed protein product [Mytilus coruscus]|uniref:Uncharacterized protein n=1 Tax=Mytilus coruscus TaxID=42192 RepID=A0A6J7ZZL8_MYTCO|nr:unnamed protein product [Mytilus coruscus]
MPSFPEFILPHHDNDFTTVLNQSENEVYLGLQFNHASALELERETIHQGQTKLWHKVRQHRLTSSIFKDVCGRKQILKNWLSVLLNKKNFQTAAMKFGIEHESAAAKLYSDITGNNVYLWDVTSLEGHKVQWKDTQANDGPEISFDDIPYINVGWMVKEC